MSEDLEGALKDAQQEIIQLRKLIDTRLRAQMTLPKYYWGLVIAALPVLLLLSPLIALFTLYRKSRKAIRARQVSKKVWQRNAGLLEMEMTEGRSEQPKDIIAALDQISPSELQYPELVSIIMPNYNNTDYIEVALKSALTQAHVNVEVILVDDHSTDGSLAIAQTLAESHTNLRILPLLKNFGCYYARNSGLAEAQGKYILFADADDLLHPKAIYHLLNALNETPGAIAAQGRARRWSDDFETPLTKSKFVENTLLFERSVTDKIGYYDTVKFGADSEFRERLTSAFGRSAIAHTMKETYFLRATPGSLTMQHPAYRQSESGIEEGLSSKRYLYRTNFRLWHHILSRKGKTPTQSFPQMYRPYELGSETQNASPSLGEIVVGRMATFPERHNTLRETLPSILAQVDQLHIYLNEYETVPDFMNNPKIFVVIGRTHRGDLRDNGKFFGVEHDIGYIFTFDDDIVYPPDYVARMIHAIETFERRAIIGVHGVIFPDARMDYMEQRTVSQFPKPSGLEVVDLLGTGTAAFHSSTISVNLDDFKSKGLCDLWFARAAHLQNVPLININRDSGWLRQFELDASAPVTGLFQEAKRGDGDHTKLYHEFLYPLVENGAARRKAWQTLTQTFERDRLELIGLAQPSIKEARNMMSSDTSNLSPAKSR